MNRILKSVISVTFALGILVIGVPISAEDGSAFPERGKAPEGKELEIMIQRANLGLDRAPEIPEELWPEHGPATGLAYRSQAEETDLTESQTASIDSVPVFPPLPC